MSSGHSTTFRVRHYHCDPYGHLATAHYLRLVEESEVASRGSAQPGSAFFEFARPVMAGDEIEVVAADLATSNGPVLRGYVLGHPGGDEPAANAWVLWLCGEAAAGRQIGTRGSPAATAGSDQPSLHPPALPDPPPGVFIMERRVLWHDIDAQYRMSLSAYGRFVVDCSIEVGAHFGWSVQRSQEQGLVYVARRFWIEIDQPVTLGEDLRISTYVSQLKRSTLVRHYVFHRLPEVEPVAVAHILWVSVDANSGRPIRQPREWLADFESNIV